jgi:hypothetical protein
MIGPYYITTDARRRAAWGKPCVSNTPAIQAGQVVLNGKTYNLHSAAVVPFQVFEHIRAKHNYVPTGTDTGFYDCRHMQHNPALPMSYHSWGMALDINWLQNPAGNKLVTDIPKAMRDEILALRTVSGARVFRWGGDWDWDGVSSDHSYIDAMHWEVVAHPLDLATGIKGYENFNPSTQGDPMLGFTIGPLGAKSVGGPVGNPIGDQAQALQEALLLRGEKLPQFGPDRFAGDETRHALRAFQGKNGVKTSSAEYKNGRIGPKTHAALYAKAGGSGGVTAKTVDSKVAAHAGNPDAHHA